MNWLKVLIVYFFLIFIIFSLKLPNNDRDWAEDQMILAQAEIDGDLVTFHNIRNFSYRTTSDYDKAYYSKTFNVSQVESLWFMKEHFSEFDGLAHALLSFGFEDGSYISISPEIRKEKGESFSPAKGMIREFELMYVVGDERDLIGLRTNYRDDLVFLYPMDATKNFTMNVFLDMAKKVDGLNDQPEFYNTVTNSCSMSLLKHVNKFYPKGIPVGYQVLFPGYSDSMLYEEGLIKTDLNFEDAQKKYRITEKAQEYGVGADFSRVIRD